ncbi:hypothetical protein CLV59_105276 [Chitinophaga dinghuensis]|uniref:Uncharacterized protein n=2 Tax=Chitinophaga dinghuensis TaxID=1539050 RepID=A0A327W5A6_9BACT|nr:hypothetical protein CLV59_105276 [Chitinophaga dinghuensis]
MGTYTYTRSLKIIGSIIFGLFLIIGLAGEILLFCIPTTIEAIVFFSILYPATIFSCGYAINNFFSSIILDSEGIQFRSPLYKRVLPWKDVSKVKFTDHGIIIHRTAGALGFNVSSSRQGYQDIIAFISERFTIVQEKPKPAQQLSATTPETAVTDEKLLRKISQVNSISGYLIIVMAVFGYIMLTTGYRIRGLDYIQFFFVPLMLYGIIHYRSIVHIHYFPPAYILLIIISLSLITSPERKYKFYNNDYWIYVLIVFAVLVVLLTLCLLATQVSLKDRIMHICIWSMGFFLCSCGIVNYTNIVLDNTAPVRYRTTVLNKRIRQSSKTSSSEMEFKGWRDEKPVTMDVHMDLYLKYEVNQEVEVDMWPGRLGIPWYQFVENK